MLLLPNPSFYSTFNFPLTTTSVIECFMIPSAETPEGFSFETDTRSVDLKILHLVHVSDIKRYWNSCQRCNVTGIIWVLMMCRLTQAWRLHFISPAVTSILTSTPIHRPEGVFQRWSNFHLLYFVDLRVWRYPIFNTFKNIPKSSCCITWLQIKFSYRQISFFLVH